MKTKKVLFTGGGSAGHITLNLSLIPLFQNNGWNICYIGSKKGLETELVSSIKNVTYHSISTGKLRRYFSLKNISDMLKIPIGIMQAYFIIKKENPDIVFSKGGFVSFPVVIGAWLNNKRVVMHESDVTTGLANKMAMPFVYKLFTTFEETKNHIKQKSKVMCVGPITSSRLANGNIKKALDYCKLNNSKPVILIMGGSLGAKSINNAIRSNLEQIIKKYQIIHICGKNQVNKNIKQKGYAQFEYVTDELKDIMACAEVVISRAGSNSIFELLSLKKPMILIPLPSTSSRGEQSLNANDFYKKGFCEIIKDKDISNGQMLVSTIDSVFENKEKYIKKMNNNQLKTTTNDKLFNIIIKEITNEY